MGEKKLVEYLDRLKPVQKEFITFCVVEYGNRPDFHMGLLPFLLASEATLYLKMHMEKIISLKIEANQDHYPGERFLKQTLSVIADHYGHRLYENEVSEVLLIKTVKLKWTFRPYRMCGKFLIRPTRHMCLPAADCGERLVELQMISCDKWRVTGHPADMLYVTMWLIDTCG